MLARVLIDNLSRDGLICEWGLSLYIETMGRKLLLDAGTTGSFADNARDMGVRLEDVELCVLSHAHYDHANGFDRFFAINDHAPVYIAPGARENCYGWKKRLPYYIGIRKGMLKEKADRFIRAEQKQQVLPGVWLLAHSTPGLEKMGKKGGLYVREGLWLRTDSFRHEQSLILEEGGSLIVLNSCSHSGPDVVIREVEAAFPGKKVRAIIGGFHLFRSTDGEVCALAERLRKCGTEHIITGHCSGDRAYEILHEELGERVRQMYTGMTIEI